MSVFDEIGGGVFRRRYESLDLNIGLVIGETAVLLVDSRASHRQADQLRDELRELTELPVGWVVNTHYHWDHTWGNARFPEAALWGHELCRRQMLRAGDAAREQAIEWMPPEHHDAIREVIVTPPTETFTETARIDLGDRIVLLSYHGKGHTDSDIVVRVPDAEVIFAGDLVEEGAPPSFGDSFPLDWASTLDMAMQDGVTIVPGHGDLVDDGFVADQRAEIASVADMARSGFHDRAPIESLTDLGPYPPATMWSALTRAFAQLDGRL